MKSRLYGLFPYIDWDENGTPTIHKATDDNSGCWGHVMPSLNIPIGFGPEVTEENGVETEWKLEGGQTYSYRTVMEHYYRFCKDDGMIAKYQGFFDFIDSGIGKEYVDKDYILSELNKSLPDGEKKMTLEDLDLIPSYVYIVTCARLVDEYQKVKYRCEVDKNLEGEKPAACCVCNQYKRMGGDPMREWLLERVAEAENLADKYLAYGVMSSATVDFNVKLNQSANDLGYLSAYLNEWIPGEKHYAGTLYTYTDENGFTDTWICVKDNTDYFDCRSERYVFPDGVNKYNVWKDDKDYEFVERKTEKCFVRVSEQYSGDKLSSKNDKGVVWNYALVSKLEPPTKLGSLNDEDNDPIQTDSKLQTLRSFKDYLNIYGEIETPEDGEDWLYYYRKGRVIDYTMGTDADGNIELDSDGKAIVFGNLITDIVANSAEHTITFTYKVGVRLLPQGRSEYTDDDGNKIVTYTGFIEDSSDTKHGITYRETYWYEIDGELYGLVQSGKFADYVADTELSERSEGNEDSAMDNLFKKYAFVTSDNTMYAEKRLEANIITIPYLPTRLETSFDMEEDVLYAPTFKTDFLTGITHKPIVNNEVFIDRGSNAMYERHVKLGEVKTLQDMENYANGSMFPMMET